MTAMSNWSSDMKLADWQRREVAKGREVRSVVGDNLGLGHSREVSEQGS
jgi:hypothetical protein